MTNELKKEINALRNDITKLGSFYMSDRLFEILEQYSPVLSNIDVKELSKICVNYVSQASTYHKMNFIATLSRKHLIYHYSNNSLYHAPMVTLYNIMIDVMNSVKENEN